MRNDLTSQQFGRLTVIHRHPENTAAGKARWVCRCSCGNQTIAVAGSLRAGHTTSCGCLHRERLASGDSNRTHGLSKSVEYSHWKAMIKRCHTPTATDYPRYGGRGINVCDRWRTSFTNFLEDMGNLPGPKYTIDRRNVESGYEPGNCYWATPVEQARNTRRTRRFEYRSETLSLPEWCERLGVNYRLVYCRVHVSGWSFSDAVETPKMH